MLIKVCSDGEGSYLGLLMLEEADPVPPLSHLLLFCDTVTADPGVVAKYFTLKTNLGIVRNF